MKATKVGENLDRNNKLKMYLRDYVRQKYDGVEPRIMRTILFPFQQLRLKRGMKLYGVS